MFVGGYLQNREKRLNVGVTHLLPSLSHVTRKRWGEKCESIYISIHFASEGIQTAEWPPELRGLINL